MLRFVICSSLLLVAGTSAASAPGKDPAKASCDAKYFDDLVGRGMDELRSIQGSDYRVLAQGTARGAANPKRMTVTVNMTSRTIVAVDCG